MSTGGDLTREFTGMVAAGMAVRSDMDAGTATCRRCPPDDGVLRVGDRVTATACHYDNHTWELLGLFCGSHPVDSVAATMGVDGVDQAVIRVTLEQAGYHDPTGTFHPDALTLGAVEVLDYSPAADGY